MRKLFTEILKHVFIAVIQLGFSTSPVSFLNVLSQVLRLHWKMIVSVTLRLLEENKVQSGYLELRLR